MSWFSDIASRAEDLLTKVDQTAASALQKPLLPNAKTTFMSYTKSPGRSSTTRAVRCLNINVRWVLTKPKAVQRPVLNPKFDQRQAKASRKTGQRRKADGISKQPGARTTGSETQFISAEN
ncbi:hypothetical protein HPB50_001040 [Hyalomma asiaticum]|uniref:Uncharacterized protein n=1 Tax=Hyalomma asiaticum TaxID=266040 RepID=A0ACB7RL64_HYAAI|nr:hypothetical protein HPB50_001040 [Hyalomma asiaticum]